MRFLLGDCSVGSGSASGELGGAPCVVLTALWRLSLGYLGRWPRLLWNGPSALKAVCLGTLELRLLWNGPSALKMLAGCAALTISAAVYAQEAPAPAPEADHGKVVFSSDQAPGARQAAADVFPKTPVTNEERSAVAIVSDDLDLHLTPAEAREEGHALLTIKNVSAAPVTRIPLQISSTLRWQSVTPAGRSKQTFAMTQSPVTTDEDHTGYAQEAVLTLDHALAAGATIAVSAFYSGAIPASTDRLELIGTPHEKAIETDWDAIQPTTDEGSTALRGFGEVLWYPVAAPTALFGEGNSLVTAVSAQRLADTVATMRLRLTVLYAGDPPDAVIFNGALRPLAKIPDDANQVVDNTRGVAAADFAMAPIGFRTPSLFLTAQQASSPGTLLLSVVSPVPEAAEPYAAAADMLAPLFHDWIAPAPLTPLLLLEHAGLPFEDHAFIAAHLSARAQPDSIAPEIVRGLAHAFFSTGAPTSQWLDQGVPEFMSLLWTERVSGRNAALAQLQENASAISFAEPELSKNPTATGTPLTQAGTDVYLRLKAAAVLWQLREIVGEDLFRNTLTNYRHTLSVAPGSDRDPAAFERSMEKTCSRDLSWFFNDWVYTDRGLPDLTIAEVNPRPILPRGGRASGYLVAVDVRNDGDAVAEVPVTVRSAGDDQALTASSRVRVPAHSIASTRIVFEGTPDSVQVNDGSVPEVLASTHTVHVKIESK